MSSLFGSRSSAPSAFGPSAPSTSQRLEEAAIEIDAVSDLFNRIVKSCHSKCVPDHFHEGSLNKGEGVCIDRCVSKYFAVNDLVSKRMQAQQEQQVAPQEQKSGGFGSMFGM